MKSIHVSQLWLARRCGNAICEESETSEAAQIGTAVHALIADYLRAGGMTPQEVCRIHGLPDSATKPVTILFYHAKQIIEYLGESIPLTNAKIEMPLRLQVGDIELLGTPDLRAIENRTLYIPDWKSGKVKTVPHDQLMGYAVLADLPDELWDMFQPIVGWLDFEECEVLPPVSRETVLKFKEQIFAEINRNGDKFVTGDHCGYCKRQDCPARNAWARNAIEIIGGVDDKLPVGTQMADAYFTIQKISHMIEKAEQNLKQQIIEELKTGAVITASDGTALAISERGTKPEIDDAKAFEILSKEIEPTELLKCARLALGDLNQLVADRARRTIQPDGKRVTIKSEKERIRATLISGGALREKSTFIISKKGQQHDDCEK